jgi:YD repeat-containing protein
LLKEQSDSESGTAAVNVAGGDLMIENEDVPSEEASAGPRLDRYYNSQASARPGALGPRWSWDSGPDVYLRNFGVSIVLHGPSGYVVALQRESSTTYSAPESFEGTLTKNENGTYTLSGTDEATYQFNSLGAVTSYTNEEAQTFTATDTTVSGLSVLHSLSPSTGKPLELTYNSTPRVTQTTDPGGHVRHYEYNSSGELATYINPSGEKTEYGYESAGYLDKITTPNGTVESITTTNGKVSELAVVQTGEAAYGDKFTYESPAAPVCNPTSDAGETVVTRTPAVEGELPETYCYNSLGAITGYFGPEGEIEDDATESEPVEQEQLPAGTCYPEPELPETECGQDDPPPAYEEENEGEAETMIGAQPLTAGAIPDLGPTHYGISDDNGVLTKKEVEEGKPTKKEEEEGKFNLFTNYYFEALHVVNVRRTVPWNLVWEAKHDSGLNSTRQSEIKHELEELEAWIEDVKKLGFTTKGKPNETGQPTVSFGYCGSGEAGTWLNPEKPTEPISCRTAPSEKQYETEIKEFRTTAPMNEVKYFTAWNEPNRRVETSPKSKMYVLAPGEPKGGISPSGKPYGEGGLAGAYWYVLNKLCDSDNPKKPYCEVAAGDFLDTWMTDAADAHTTNDGGTFYKDYVAGMRHGDTAYRWAWHAYSEGEEAGTDFSNPNTWWKAYEHFIEAVDTTTASMHKPPEVWLTEQGVIYEKRGKKTKIGEYTPDARQDLRAYVEDGAHQLTRQAYMGKRQITRFFYYQMRGNSVWDSGLLEPSGRPRKIYGIYKKKTLGD